MKLQAAIDRVTLEQAEAYVKAFAGTTDIIEIGTSLVKDYGLLNLKPLNALKGTTRLLADLKTSDEGDYEFKQGYAQGFDFLTAMGAASRATLEKCYAASQAAGKEMMIDLLECDDRRIAEIADFTDAVYCLHTSIDKGQTPDPAGEVWRFKTRFPEVRRIAIAGGVGIGALPALREQGTEIVIVGAAITGAPEPIKMLEMFRKEC